MEQYRDAVAQENDELIVSLAERVMKELRPASIPPGPELPLELDGDIPQFHCSSVAGLVAHTEFTIDRTQPVQVGDGWQSGCTGRNTSDGSAGRKGAWNGPLTPGAGLGAIRPQNRRNCGPHPMSEPLRLLHVNDPLPKDGLPSSTHRAASRVGAALGSPDR